MRFRAVVGAAALVAVSWAAGTGAVAQEVPTAPSAQLQVTPASAAPGELVLVDLRGWPNGPVQAFVCGNGARRGSADCNLAGAKGDDVIGGTALFKLRVAAPPIHCPCVVRAESRNGSTVRQVPFEVIGQPMGPEMLPETATVSSRETTVKARLEDADAGLVQRLLPLVAGPVNKTLVMTVRNDSDRPIEQIRVVGSVGRSRSEAEPLASTVIETLGPGDAETVRIPVRIGVPAWGRYEVFGTVYGMDVPQRFSTTTSNEPWGLELLVPVVLLVLAWLARRREVEERAAGEEPLQESSPPVGSEVGDSSQAHSYAPAHAVVT